jgi:hypothetical protein
VKLLPANDGVDPDSKCNAGLTPLSWAAEKGPDVYSKSANLRRTASMRILRIYRGQTQKGHYTVVKLLLTKDGVDLDSKDTKCGLTPTVVGYSEREWGGAGETAAR